MRASRPTSALAATTVLGRVLEQSMEEAMVDQMGDTNGCQLIPYLYPITKHRTSEVTGFR